MSLFRRQLLYLTNDRLTAYLWEKDNHTTGQTFLNDAAGWEAFSSYLATSPNTQIYLLADLIEEDFQLTSLPHVLGRPRHTLAQRRLSQLYRDTPFRQAIHQGREEFGRKDDRLLFSAITNSGLLKPWLEVIQKLKAPLTGIVSPALLSATLIKKLELSSDNLLLVTHQSNGLRQSFFQGAALKFSRLTPLADHNPDTVAEAIARETLNTQQFLASTRQLQRGDTMAAAILAHETCLQQLQPICSDNPAITYQFLDLVEAATRIGLKNPTINTLCDPLFLALLGRVTPASHYAQPEHIRCFRLWQTRLALYLLSASILLGAVSFAGSNGFKAWQHYQQSQQMRIEMGNTQSQSQIIIDNLPKTVASPQTMKAAVDIEGLISKNEPTPKPLLDIVSHALDKLPQIQVNSLHWKVNTDTDSTNPTEIAPAPPQAALSDKVAPPIPAQIGLPRKPRQILLIGGEVIAQKQDYRTALESVRLFADELEKNKQLQVKIIQSPLDVKPGVSLSGSAGANETKAKILFSLKLTLRPES